MVLKIFVLLFLVTGLYQTFADDECCSGVQVPDFDCLLSWDDFVNHVVGIEWRAIYGILGLGNSSAPKMYSVTWNLLPDGSLQRYSVFWSDFLERCNFLNNTFGGGACSGKSRISPFPNENSVLVGLNREDRFASTDPDKYLIYSVCFDALQTCRGLCPSYYTVVLVKDQRTELDGDGYQTGPLVLNGIPWCDIEETLNECFNLTILSNTTDRQIEWTWRGENECRLPR